MNNAGGVERTELVLDDVRREVSRSIAKHGPQADVPMGTGPQTTPVARIVRGKGNKIENLHYAFGLANQAKSATDAAFADGTLTWWDILAEEVFESSAEACPMKLRAELVQVAAVAVKMCEVIDRRARNERDN